MPLHVYRCGTQRRTVSAMNTTDAHTAPAADTTTDETGAPTTDQFVFEVVETVTRTVTYYVNAATVTEAEEMALRGETVAEEDTRDEEVIDRSLAYL